MYEYFGKLLQKHGVTPYKVSKETGVSQSTLSDWKRGISTPKHDKLQKIADYFDVTVDYLISGNESTESSNQILTPKDERDIAKDLNHIMSEIRNGESGPLYYDGVEIDEKSLILLENAIEHALRETKKENKIKYDPHKNKK